MYATLLFDLDGTLIDSAPDIAASVNHTRAIFGQAPLTLEEVKGAVGDGLANLLERTVQAPPEESRRVYHAHHREHLLDHTVLYPGVREGLARLSGKVRLGVVTNKPQAFTEKILLGLAIAPLFGAVVGGDTSAGRKPEPGPLLAAMQQLGAPSWSTMMVGDSLGDLRAARAANAASCAVSWGYRELATLRAAEPDHEVHTFAEIEALLTPASVFEAVGRDRLLTLARAFYARVEHDPRIRALFPPFLDQAAEHQALFLMQFFGGPSEYTRQRGAPRLRMRHAPFRIDRAGADAWLEHMLAAMQEVAMPEPAAGVMRRYFAHTAGFLINSG